MGMSVDVRLLLLMFLMTGTICMVGFDDSADAGVDAEAEAEADADAVAEADADADDDADTYADADADADDDAVDDADDDAVDDADTDGPLCRSGYEYSLKLNFSAFERRRHGERGFLKELEGKREEFHWFRLLPRRGRRHVRQVVYYLDVPDGSFAKHNVMVRFRRRIRGKNAGKTDIVLKAHVAPVQYEQIEMPLIPATKWKPAWHCKCEANVGPSGELVWQRGAKVMAHKPHSAFARKFPDPPTSLGNITEVFPWAADFVGLSATRDADMPLLVVKKEYRWLHYVTMKFRRPPPHSGYQRMRGILTLQYASRVDMEVYRVPPTNVDFEWKTTRGTRTWQQNDHSFELLSRLGQSRYALNRSAVGVVNMSTDSERSGALPVFVLAAFCALACAIYLVSNTSLRRLPGATGEDTQNVYLRINGAC